jgi:CubicO group peptidase (beta-lactamase class C family)
MRFPIRPLLLLLAAVPAPLAGQRRDAARAVDSMFAAYTRPGSPGCGVGVIRDGRLVHRADYGTGDLARGTPLGPRSSYYMASVSKQFAAAAVALASLQGHLSLDDDVRRWVPELPVYGPPVTVRHLVHHTSGLRDYLGLLGLAGRLAEANPDSAVVALIARQRGLNFAPGTQYSYSNSGYMLLSVVIRRATGLSLRDYAERELFGPLGMRDTYFHDDHTRPHPAGARHARGYYARDGRFEDGVLARFEQVGDGGLISTVEDMLLWDRNFEDGRVGGRAFLELMHTTGVLADGTPIDYAFGLRVTAHAGLPTVMHGGLFQGYRTILQRFPAQRFSVVILCNHGSAAPDELAAAIAHEYLADAFQAAQAELAGEYWSEELGAGRRVEVRGGRAFSAGAGGELPLRPQGRDTYSLDSPLGRAVLRFTRAAGRVTGFDLDLGPTRGIRFERR